MDQFWNVVGASVAGTAHNAKDLPCQDAFNWWVTNEYTILAVADGAGSAAEGGTGAKFVVDHAVETLKNSLILETPKEEKDWLNLLHLIFLKTHENLLGLANKDSVPPRDYSTTLSLAILGPIWFAAGQIGDGVMVSQLGDGTLTNVIKPQQGQYVNETLFITMEDAPNLAEYKFTSGEIDGFAIMSDGLLRLALELPGQNPFPNFFNPLFKFSSKAPTTDEDNSWLIDFLDSDRVNLRTNDDKTLLIATRNRQYSNPDVVKR